MSIPIETFIFPEVVLKLRRLMRDLEGLLGEFVVHVSNLHCHPQNVRRRLLCLGIGVWMSTTSVASKTFEFEMSTTASTLLSFLLRCPMT